jgi:uncharacterized repeat protein (TIGR04052 family)
MNFFYWNFRMNRFIKPTLAASSLIAAAVLTACGGGGGASTPTVSLAGVVADGYLTGAKVCLDKNENSVCDAGEPFATTGTGGKYSIDGLTAADAAAYPVVAEVPAAATDSDFAGTSVGKAFVLTAPKGNTTITPLSSLVHLELQATPALSAASAAANVQTAMAITADPLKDYIATPDADAHLKAQLLTQSVKTNSDALGGGTVAERKKLQETLFALAKDSVMASPPAKGASAPASVASAPAVGFEDFNTVRAVLANKLTTGTASQAVTLNFDVVNGATSVKACDSVTLPGLKLWDQAPLTATPPSAATLLATSAQTTQQIAGQMVDIRFFISNVLLWDAAGNAVPLVMTEDAYQSKNVALMDFGRNTAATGAAATCTAPAHTAITGKVVPGTYTGISYTLGVPVRSADMTTKLNHSASTTAMKTAAAASAPAAVFSNPIPPLDTVAQPGMAWNWQGGRKFTKIEFKTTTPAKNITAGVVGTNAVFNVHIGSTGCSGNPVSGVDTACTNPNRLGVKFAAFNTAVDTVKLDLAALYANVDATYEGGGAGGCMSGTTDPECAGIFKSLGLSLTNGQTLTGAAIQTVFGKK